MTVFNNLKLQPETGSTVRVESSSPFMAEVCNGLTGFLQRPYIDQIMILRKLYKWEKQHLSDAVFLTSPMKDIKKEELC
jgi:hypothetical protein